MTAASNDPESLFRALCTAAGPARLRSFPRGALLFRRGDRVEFVFWLSSGRIRLERSLEDGSSVTVHVARAPALLAEASLFGSEYHCDAVAEVASEVERLDREAVVSALDRDASLARLLLRRLASEVRELRQRLEIRSVRPVEKRVLLGLEIDDWADRSVAERAAELGMAPETLSRALAKLEAEGEIRRRGRAVTRTR